MSTCTAQFTSIQTAIIMFGEEDGKRGSVFTPDLANIYILARSGVNTDPLSPSSLPNIIMAV